MATRPLLKTLSESLPHRCTIMANPTKLLLPAEYLLKAREEVAAIAATISRFEPVTILSRPDLISSFQAIPDIVKAGDRIKIQELEVDHPWVRDTGCVFVYKAENEIAESTLHAVDFNFNNWGEKYPIPAAADYKLPRGLSEHLKIPYLSSPLTTEGGALETDGAGTLLATESSILNENRNAGRTKPQVEHMLKKTLGIQKIIWLKGLRNYDSTDCHVDALARFAIDRTQPTGVEALVLLSRPHPSRPPAWMETYEEARAVLEREYTAEGRRIHVVDVPEPPTYVDIKGEPDDPVASYVNFAWVNGGIVMPLFGEREYDDNAVEIFRRCFPKRTIAPVSIKTLPMLGGGIHCVTLQVPV